MEPTLTKEIANQIWTILKEEAGSREEERGSFVYHQTKGCTEYRVGGPLGYGGKFWNYNKRWYVNTYPETLEREPSLSVIIERTNRRLESLRSGLIDNRLPA